MDRLDELAAVADPLLRQVDGILADAGAPPDHPVWGSLRRVGLLSTDAVHCVANLRPAEFVDAAPQLRARAAGYAETAASLPAPVDWTGEAADAYDTARTRLAAYLSGDPESLAERLDASADLIDALVGWMRQTRDTVAGALAAVLGSAEAVILVTATTAEAGVVPVPLTEVRAAAAVADRVLRTVADAYDGAAELVDGSVELAATGSAPGAFRPAWSDRR